MAVGLDGEPTVVFTKWNNSEGNYRLKLGNPWIFRDGFETSDTILWSVSTE
jgi:hypothetical protein